MAGLAAPNRTGEEDLIVENPPSGVQSRRRHLGELRDISTLAQSIWSSDGGDGRRIDRLPAVAMVDDTRSTVRGCGYYGGRGATLRRDIHGFRHQSRDPQRTDHEWLRLGAGRCVPGRSPAHRYG